MPSAHTTVVLELGGTTTVVLAGGGGLLLLMQPPSSGIVHSKLAISFIASSSAVALVNLGDSRPMPTSATAALPSNWRRWTPSVDAYGSLPYAAPVKVSL